MIPVSPVIPGQNYEEKIIAENQEEFQNLPAIVCGDGTVVTRWELNDADMEAILQNKFMYLLISTGGRFVQPVLLTTEEPQLNPLTEEEKPKVEQVAETQNADANTIGNLVESLIGNFDANAWATVFVEVVKTNPHIVFDVGAMRAWFAGAIMAGYDKKIVTYESQLAFIDAALGNRIAFARCETRAEKINVVCAGNQRLSDENEKLKAELAEIKKQESELKIAANS